MVKFVIITATYNRKNGKTPFYIKKSIDSVLCQIHDDWDLIIVGDKYEPEEEILKIIDEYKIKTVKNKIIYIKNDITERDYVNDKHNLWTCAGATSVNVGLEYARKNNYKYYCHLDDDDYWNDNHLYTLNSIYIKYPNCVFANTQSTHPHRYLPALNIDIFENNLLPTPGEMIHSSISFKIDIIDYYYYTNLTNTGRYYPSDADMLGRIRNFILTNKNLCSIYVPILTCFHITECESM
jgi:hypothetical protein